MTVRNCVLCLVLSCAADRLHAESEVLAPRLHHLRIDDPREWSSFPEHPEAASLELTFDGSPNASEASLRLRQQDVKQTWRVKLNDRVLGQLIQDENDLALILPVPAGAIAAGKNTLRIEQNAGARAVPDDIRVGEIVLDSRSTHDVLT